MTKSSTSIWRLLSKPEIDGENFVNFCCLLRKRGLYMMPNVQWNPVILNWVLSPTTFTIYWIFTIQSLCMMFWITKEEHCWCLIRKVVLVQLIKASRTYPLQRPSKFKTISHKNEWRPKKVDLCTYIQLAENPIY